MLRFLTLYLSFSFLFLTFAQSASPPRVPKISSEQQMLLDLIRKSDFEQQIQYLASDALEGRGSATQGERLAGDYIAKHFQEFGLKPAGEEGTYFQSFEVVTGHKYYPDNRLALQFNGIPSRFEIDKEFVPFAFSSDGEANSTLVFAGYGITNPEANYDDYANLDVQGKIVLLLRREPTNAEGKSRFAVEGKGWSKHAEFASKAKNAQEHGAAGVIIFNDSVTVKAEGDQLLPFGGWGQKFNIPCIHLKASIGDAILMAAGLNSADLQQDINTHLKPNSFLIEGMSVSLKAGIFKTKATARNVLGILEGTDEKLKNEFIVIGGHYDHLGYGEHGGSLGGSEAKGQIHNGADDNASGTSGVINLAKAFSQIPNRPRSLVFMAFSGEEEGLLGSDYYTKNPTIPLEQCITMINLDMIGRLQKDQLQIGGIGTSPTFEAEMNALNEHFGFKLSLNKAGRGPSDHTSFYVKNIPVLFFFTGVHSDYHKPSDDVDKVNYEGTEKIIEMVSFQVHDLMTRETRPVFQRAAAPQGGTSSRAPLKVQLGIMPGYNEDGKGLEVSDVSEGKPAQLGGIRGGDRIIKLDGREITNIYDYMDVMSKANPQDVMKVTVLREGKEMVFTVVLVGR